MKLMESRWVRSLIVIAAVLTILSIYLFLRRGYYTIYIVNKVFGSASVFIAGLTLIVGPLSKRVSWVTRFMTIRRELGLSAFYLALVHVVLSLWQQSKFPFPKWYLDEWIPVTFGLITIIIWYYMRTISKNEKIVQMGADVWKRRLSIAGKLGFLAVFLHLSVMKYQGWFRWWNGEVKQTPELANPSYPPASLFIFFIMVVVIVYRVLADYVFPKKTPNSTISTPDTMKQ